MDHFKTCAECIGYAERRRSVLLPAMAEHCERTGELTAACLVRYMTGVHDRHSASLSLAVTA